MSLDSVRGFIPQKIQSLTISSDDCERYGIKTEDFKKVDKNGDGLVDANEFLSGGLNTISIFNAFRTIAQPMGGFTDEKQANNEQSQNQYAVNNLNNSNMTNPYQGQKLFFSA